ncbi:Rrf2 family protein [Bacillus thuringiensis serovar israelensis ATCC 35646]|nr:Rrf2 family protein [Bacillus thuringiensis serovar israelensis ATCC 35646]
MNKKEGVQMGISSRFTVGVHMLTLLAIDRNSRCTSEWIAGSVNTNPVVIRRITRHMLQAAAGLVDVQAGKGGHAHLLEHFRSKLHYLMYIKPVASCQRRTAHFPSIAKSPTLECPR